MSRFRIYKVDGREYELVAEVEADRPRTVMAQVRAARPGVTITCDGAGMGSDLLCVPAEADRIAKLIETCERNRRRQPELYRIYALRPDGKQFVYELEDELFAESALHVEERVRSRVRRQTGLRVRFGNPYCRRDARDPGVLYCRVERAEHDLIESSQGDRS